MQKYILLFCLTLLFVPALNMQAQKGYIADSVDNMIIYSNEKSGSIIAHSRGLGFGFRTAKNTTAFKTQGFSFEMVSMKSPKQIKTVNPYYADSRSYVYGKLNDVFVGRAGFNRKIMLNRKPYWGGVEVRLLYEAGLEFALEKPYYLFVVNIVQSPQGGLIYVIETETFDSGTYSWDDIYGRAPFVNGLGEMKFKPGVYGKLGFNFEFGAVKTTMRAAEIGVIVDVFPQSLKMMDDGTNQIAYINFYISYSMGKRYNKY